MFSMRSGLEGVVLIVSLFALALVVFKDSPDSNGKQVVQNKVVGTVSLDAPEVLTRNGSTSGDYGQAGSPPGTNLEEVGILLPKQNRSIVLVHVGKCGGSTVSSLLPKRHCFLKLQEKNGYAKCEECRNRHIPMESQLSKLCWGAQHLNSGVRGHDKLADFTTFLISVRDPISRMISAFNFQHPNNTRSYWGKENKDSIRIKYYQHCFPHLQEFVIGLRMPSPELDSTSKLNAVSPDCRKLGLSSLLSVDPRIDQVNRHLYYGFRKYHEGSIDVYPEYEVLVIRTEQFWDDVKALEVALGGSGFFDEGVAKRQNLLVAKSKQNTYVSAEDKANLCCIMYKEMEAYQDMIMRAANLVLSDKRSTLASLYKECGISIDMDSVNSGTTLTAIMSDSSSFFLYLLWEQWYHASCPLLDMTSLERRPNPREKSLG